MMAPFCTNEPRREETPFKCEQQVTGTSGSYELGLGESLGRGARPPFGLS